MPLRSGVLVPPRYKKAFKFFYEHGGFSYDPKKESRTQGRRRCALNMAVAEDTAAELGWKFEWRFSEEPYEMGDAETKMPSEVYDAVAKDEGGHVVASLGQIGDPDRNYIRVVNAELALEGFASKGYAAGSRE